MFCQVGAALEHCLHIFFFQVFKCDISMLLQGTDRRNDHDRIRMQIRETAFDIQKFLGPQISTKACFRHCIVGQLQTHFGCQYRVASMGDVGERPAMHDHRIMFQCLYQVRLDGIFHDHGQCTLDMKIPDIYRLALCIVCHQHIGKAFLQVLQRSCQA